MSCPDCTQSAARDWHGFSCHCQGCVARIVARGPAFFAASKAQKGDADFTEVRDRYRAELALFGVSHEQVKAAAGADALGKKPA